MFYFFRMESILWNIFSVVMVILLYTWKKYYMKLIPYGKIIT